MAITYVNTGTSANKGDGDSLRAAFSKINNNFAEIDQRVTSATNSTIIDNISVNGSKIQSTGTIEIVPNVDLYSVGQYIKIYPTNAFDYPHVHIESGQNGELYIGNDQQYIKTGIDGSVQIQTANTGLNFTKSWTFDISGDLIFPDSSAQTTAYIKNKENSGWDISSPTVSIGNFSVGLNSSGNPTISAVTGTFTCVYSLQETTYDGSIWTSTTLGSTGTVLNTGTSTTIGITFAYAGDMVTGTFCDTTGGNIYKAQWIATPSGPSTGYGSIIVEKIL